MIQVLPVRYNTSWSQDSHIHTHILTPHNKATIAVSIEGKRENIISILEDHLLETISGISWDSQDSDDDFKYLTENYNRFIRNLDQEDLADISVIISLLKGTLLTVSAIGNATAYLVEGDSISQITQPEKGRMDFHTLTEGDVSRNASIYISTKNSLEILGNELLLEFSELGGQEFDEVAKDIFKRELNTSFHLIRIAHSFKSVQSEIRQRGRGQLHLLKNHSSNAIQYVKNMPIWETLKSKIESIDFEKNTKQKYTYITIGGILAFVLIIFLIQGITNSLGGISDSSKSQILKAQTLITDSEKLSGNRTAFEANIKEAETILFELRNEQKYLADIQQLQNKIEVLKKEFYDIQSINLSQKTSLLPIEGSNFVPLFTFEKNNKLTIIGKNGLVYDFVRDNPLPTVISFPNNSETIDATFNADNNTPFILTNNNFLLTRRQNTITELTNNNQKSWPTSHMLKTYAGNIYLLNEGKNQIYKYKPAPNGFGASENVLPQLSSSKILDIAIDGGFYLMLEDGKIGRYVSTNKEAGITSLVLNKIPGAWNIDPSEPSQIIASGSNSYVYIRNGKNLWIFQPNSKQFRDINALTYIAQIELQSDETISDISIPEGRDGIIYITTEKGVFETLFEVSGDGKFYLK